MVTSAPERPCMSGARQGGAAAHAGTLRGERREAVAAYVVRGAECLPRQAFEEIARDRLARREGDRVHQTIERVPPLPQLGEERGDLGVARDVAGEHQSASELSGHLHDAVLEALVLVGERELRALAPDG